ncbi:hypothetical protein FB451DRAFT_1395340 [Mycena latifolia]|nr:hypothetical protein FB451DRAFT_1395340 [Mycena latifolia]
MRIAEIDTLGLVAGLQSRLLYPFIKGVRLQACTLSKGRPTPNAVTHLTLPPLKVVLLPYCRESLNPPWSCSLPSTAARHPAIGRLPVVHLTYSRRASPYPPRSCSYPPAGAQTRTFRGHFTPYAPRTPVSPHPCPTLPMPRELTPVSRLRLRALISSSLREVVPAAPPPRSCLTQPQDRTRRPSLFPSAYLAPRSLPRPSPTAHSSFHVLLFPSPCLQTYKPGRPFLYTWHTVNSHSARFPWLLLCNAGAAR